MTFLQPGFCREMNGGKVNVISAYYGVYTKVGTDCVINGGTLEVMGQRAFYSYPVLGKGVFAYVGASAKNCEEYTGADTTLAKQPWMRITNDPNQKIEMDDEEEDLDIPIFTLPTVAPTTDATAPDAPGGSDGTQATVAPEEESGIKVNISVGISEEIPEALIEAGLDTVEKIQEALVNGILMIDDTADNVAFFDAVLMFKDGDVWIMADEEHFPENGILTVVLPYPEGTNANTKFSALHMFTSSAFDSTPGELELLSPVCTEDGIEVYVTGLSPIVLAWNSAQASENPETGDISVAKIYALMLIAAMGMVTTVVIGKKRLV